MIIQLFFATREHCHRSEELLRKRYNYNENVQCFYCPLGAYSVYWKPRGFSWLHIPGHSGIFTDDAKKKEAEPNALSA
jgi:hypothetical protein